MKLKPNAIVPTPQDPFDGNLLFRNENAATALTRIIENTEGGYTLSINADYMQNQQNEEMNGFQNFD